MAKKTNRLNATQRNVTSVSELRAARAVDAVTPAFVEWCRQTEGLPAESAMELLRPVKALVGAYFHASPSSEATNFEPVPFGLALAEVLGADGEDVTSFSFDAIHVYLEFLGETGAWTGTEEDFDAVDELFHMDEEGALPAIDVPELTDEEEVPELTDDEELAALAGTGLAQRLEKLLRWLGDGRTVTSTGVLRLKEIEGAAVAVGVAVKGAMPKAKREPLPFPVGSSPDSIRTVKSMNEVPLLAKFWAALDACELVDIGSTKVWPTPLAEEFLEPGHPARLDVLRNFTTKFLAVAVMGEAEWAPWVTHTAMAQSALLFAACTDEAVGVDLLTDPATLERMELDQFAARMLQAQMEELAELGLVTLDKVIAVPPAVVPAVVAIMQSALVEEDDDPWDDPWGAGPLLPKSPAPQPIAPKKRSARIRKNSATAPILQLKIMLKGSKPPVWRRLLVRSDLTLAEFHHVMQMSFEWMDSHLHEFRVGGYDGTAYGPVGPQFDFGDPMPLDEAAVTLGAILSEENDKMDYIYDFGDNWQHAVTVEKVLPHDAGVPAVRCNGGRGAGPEEDSGGVWGWESMVEAANDPSYKEHAEYRQWLGLAPGEKLDPKEFDKDELNEELADMY